MSVERWPTAHNGTPHDRIVYPGYTTWPLPRGRRRWRASFDATLDKRSRVRTPGTKLPDAGTFGQLLETAHGITGNFFRGHNSDAIRRLCAAHCGCSGLSNRSFSPRMSRMSPSELRTCPFSTPRFAIAKYPMLQNPVGGATGVRYTRRSADGVACTFSQPWSIALSRSSVDYRRSASVRVACVVTFGCGQSPRQDKSRGVGGWPPRTTQARPCSASWHAKHRPSRHATRVATGS